MNAAISASSTPRIADRPVPPTLRVGGLVPLTTTDFPGRLAAVVFCQGCPWSCGYCHNPHLIPARGTGDHDWAQVLDLLGRRRGLLDGVVFSGGEPLAQRGLPEAMRMVRAAGFDVGLHTGGAYPERLDDVLPLVDWVGFDVKASFSDYERLTRVPGSGEAVRRSLHALLASGVDHEIRTTVHPAIFDRRGVLRLARGLADRGVRCYALQVFRGNGCLDPAYRDSRGASALIDLSLLEEIRTLFERFEIRGMPG